MLLRLTNGHGLIDGPAHRFQLYCLMLLVLHSIADRVSKKPQTSQGHSDSRAAGRGRTLRGFFKPHLKHDSLTVIKVVA